MENTDDVGIRCNEHPDAPHGFMRDASHSAGRYVCECESWEPPKNKPEQKPVAHITGYYRGHCVIQPLDPAVVLPVGMALYRAPDVFKLIEDNGLTLHGDIEHFAELIRQEEREACAKACEERQEVFQKYYTKGLAAMCAEAIRARGNK